MESNEQPQRMPTTARRDESTWGCPVCGEVPPRQYGQLYVRASCACERAAVKGQYERAMRRHREPVKRRGAATGMSRLSEGLPLRLPERVFARLGGVATAEEARRQCSVCGEIPPVRYANGYVPGTCSCQRKEHESRQAEQERLALWKARAAERERACGRCYSWLGEWSEPGLEHATFDAFDIDLQPEGFLAAYRFAEAIKAREHDPAQPPAGTLVLWSDASWGTGKTHLAATICNSLIAARVPCLFTTGQNLFHAFGARFDEGQGVNDLVAQAGDTPLLVIDDLDKTHMTASGYKSSVFFTILNRRYLKRLPTVVTTNARVEVTERNIVGLSEYLGQAACSRLKAYGLTVVRMEGVDYRHRLGSGDGRQ